MACGVRPDMYVAPLTPSICASEHRPSCSLTNAAKYALCCIPWCSMAGLSRLHTNTKYTKCKRWVRRVPSLSTALLVFFDDQPLGSLPLKIHQTVTKCRVASISATYITYRSYCRMCLQLDMPPLFIGSGGSLFSSSFLSIIASGARPQFRNFCY
jgi:hypothetical protein